MTSAASVLHTADFPRPSTSFVGRKREIATVAALLRRADVRLLSLTGAGGVGKTRLAIRVTEELAGSFADGAVFVPLGAIGDPRLVSAATARALFLDTAGDVPILDRLITYLRPKEHLLLFDTFEHLLPAAPLLADLLVAAPRLKLLVTTRAMLRISGERVVTVAPLSLSQGIESEAVRLFVDRAQAADASFALTEANATSVAEICGRLDGLPLAIELAAARSTTLPPAALLHRMERRLPLLTGGSRDLPARQQTMRAAVAWSYDLLTPDEQALFRRLAVFAGGFTLEAAEYVDGQPDRRTAGESEPSPPSGGPAGRLSVFEGIAALVERSLVRRVDQLGSEPRYAMLDTVREFGLEQLAANGEGTAVRDAHAAYLLALVAGAEPHLTGPDQAAWLDRIEHELSNLRAALAWLRDRGRVDDGLRLAAAPGRFWWRRGYLSEGRGWLEAFLALPSDTRSAHARVRALLVAGDIAAWQKDLDQAAARHGEAASLARETGDSWALAMALYGLGSDAVDRDAPTEAAPLLAESVARFRDVGDAWGVALATSKQGDAALIEGDHARAAICLEEALAVFREHQDGRFVAGVLDGLGLLALERGDAAGALRAYAEALPLMTDFGDKTGIAWNLMGHAGIAGLTGQAETSARLLGAAAALREVLGARLAPYEQGVHDRIAAGARAALGAAAFTAAWDRGATLSATDAVAEATSVVTSEPVEAGLPAAFAELTTRERDVLRLLIAGLSDKEIAQALQLSPRTASNHVAAIFAKIGVHTRQAAIQAATRHSPR